MTYLDLEKSAIERKKACSKYSQNHEKGNLEKVPITIIRNLKEHKLSCPEWIHGL